MGNGASARASATQKIYVAPREGEKEEDSSSDQQVLAEPCPPDPATADAPQKQQQQQVEPQLLPQPLRPRPAVAVGSTASAQPVVVVGSTASDVVGGATGSKADPSGVTPASVELAVTDFEDDSPGGGATSALEIDAGEEVQRGLSTRIQQRQHWLSSLEDRDTEVPQAKSSTVRVQARLPQFLDEGEGGPLEDKTTFHLPMKLILRGLEPWNDTPVAIAWVLISVGLNLWMNRAHFLDFAAKFRIRTLSAKLPVGAGWQGWQSRKSTEKEKKFKAQEDKARFSVSRRFLHVAQCSCAILLAALLFLSLVFGIPAGFACYSLSFTMVFFSLIDSGLFPVTMVSFDACLALASLAWTAVIAFSAVTPAALVQIGGRTVCRVILSLAFCNPQMSNLCLATFSSVHLYKLYNFVIMDPYLSGAAGSLVANEVAVFIIITMIVATFNGCIKESVHARVQVLVAQSCERSSKKLLSVLCEAVVTLGPDLRIAGSCRNLSHMLMAGFGSRSGGLRGALFTSLLAQGDRQRFEDFIHGFPMIDDALSDSSGTSTDSRPPGSLRVHLRDAGGLHFLVDIFHVTIPNSDDTSTSASHLIGIKEEPGAPRLPELLPPSVFPDDAWSSSPSATGQDNNNNDNNNDNNNSKNNNVTPISNIGS
ncbi:unnamed protein product [Polarella glacialis]|uniref:Uncharacterized protein n=1 Tax=Polarella glacialis TaxID=89957 RepID=A0A813LYP9_POLGL|nr:unnamed protein product [Polarella glacialis]